MEALGRKKEVIKVKQIKKEFGPFTVQYDASAQGDKWGLKEDGRRTYEEATIVDAGETNDGKATCVVVQWGKIDIRGLNQEEKTLLFSGATVQEPYFYQMQIKPGGVGQYITAPAGNGMFTTDVILNCPIPLVGETYDDQLINIYLSLLQPGFPSPYTSINFENITFAQTRQLAMTTLTGAWDTPEEISRNLLGSGAANAGEFIYCYRMFVIQFSGITNADDMLVHIPPARYLLGAQVTEEKDYVRMMRLARQYEPWQRLDRD